MKRTFIAIGIGGVGIMLLSLFAICASLSYWREPRSLADWITIVQRPGFRLLASGEDAGRYWAILRTSDCQLVICDSKRYGATGGRTGFSRPTGESVDFIDHSRKTSVLARTLQLGTSTIQPIQPDGTIIPVRADFSGPLRIRSFIIRGFDETLRLDAVVSWDQN